MPAAGDVRLVHLLEGDGACEIDLLHHRALVVEFFHVNLAYFLGDRIDESEDLLPSLVLVDDAEADVLALGDLGHAYIPVFVDSLAIAVVVVLVPVERSLRFVLVMHYAMDLAFLSSVYLVCGNLDYLVARVEDLSAARLDVALYALIYPYKYPFSCKSKKIVVFVINLREIDNLELHGVL